MKSLKNIIKIFSLVGLTLIISCNKDKLSPVPQASLEEKLAFSTPERIGQQVFGVYAGCKNGNFLGGRALVYNDVRGEDWLNITGNGVTAVGVWNFSIVSTDNQVENAWSSGYAAINRANIVLEGIDANSSLVPASVANTYRGEARFCRALTYFFLVNLYGKKPFAADAGASAGLPLRLKANKSGENVNMARSTVAQVYDQILQDLNFAETNLPLKYATSDSNVVRAHKNAAIALKTRVYLNMGRWGDVITEANKLVPLAPPFVTPTGVTHRLANAFITPFRAPYNDPESIFSFPMSNTNAPGTQNGLALYHNAEFAINPTNGILANAAWKTTDLRRAAPAPNITLITQTAAPFRYQKFNDDNNNYVPIIRYAEVMLNLAEALARLSTTVDPRALTLLNTIRQRSDNTTTFAPATQQELIDLILIERRIELLGEGFRAWDIMRQNLSFPAKGSVAAVPTTAQAYVWPIPASELLYNKQMTPN
jgi:starch-binding outer membrane protein, SusD/RagB family